MIVRPSRDGDWPAILDVHRRAFGGEVEPGMAEAVRAGDGWVPELSLVAEEDGTVVGHVLTSWVELEGSERRLLQHGPIGVLPEHQGRGLGWAFQVAVLDENAPLPQGRVVYPPTFPG